MKSGYVLSSAAALMVSTVGSWAADLPARRAAPVDYVRVCDWTGAGYFYVPGSDICIKPDGYVRAEAGFINDSRQYFPTATVGQATRLLAAGTIIPGRLEDSSGLYARGALALDTRAQTAYGTVRTYVRYYIDRLQGLYAGGGVAGGANSFANQGGNLAFLARGFVQFDGMTAGRVQSFFDFYGDFYNYEGIANSDQAQNVLAYTYNFSKQLSGTLSLESHEARTDGIGTITAGQNTVGGVSQIGQASSLTAQYGGSQVPDIVGQLNYSDAWGQAQLSAAYHQVNTVAGPYAGTGGSGFAKKDADGYAVQAGVQFKLPMLAAGDDLWIQGAYQNGGYLYQDAVAYANAGFNSRDLGGFQHIDHDAIAIGVPGSATGAYTLALSRGFSTMAAINHFFTPTFHDVLYGSYEQASYGRAGDIDWTLGGLGGFSEYRIGNQFLFDPVKNLEIGLEFDYGHIDQTLAHNPGQAATALPVGISKNPDSFEARLRMERDF